MNQDAGPHKLQLIVVYNGVEKPISAEPHQAVKAVLEHAIHAFGITSQPHLLSLFREDGTKIEENQSVQEAGMSESTVVYLRQDSVKGG